MKATLTFLRYAFYADAKEKEVADHALRLMKHVGLRGSISSIVRPRDSEAPLIHSNGVVVTWYNRGNHDVLLYQRECHQRRDAWSKWFQKEATATVTRLSDCKESVAIYIDWEPSSDLNNEEITQNIKRLVADIVTNANALKFEFDNRGIGIEQDSCGTWLVIASTTASDAASLFLHNLDTGTLLNAMLARTNLERGATRIRSVVHMLEEGQMGRTATEWSNYVRDPLTALFPWRRRQKDHLDLAQALQPQPGNWTSSNRMLFDETEKVIQQLEAQLTGTSNQYGTGERTLSTPEPAKVEHLEKWEGSPSNRPNTSDLTPRSNTMTIDELLDIRHNRDNFRRLLAQYGTPLGIVPFVGAGFSIPSGMPGWAAFLRKEADLAGVLPVVTTALSLSDYEGAAQLLFDALGARGFADSLDRNFGPHVATGDRIRGPVTRLPQITAGPVITTNFDRILEEVFKSERRAFEERVWGAKPDLFANALHSNSAYLLKIHGDVQDRTDRILTLGDYERHYGSTDVERVDFKRPLPKILEQAFTTRTLLFLGCSLSQDRTMSLLQRVASTHASPPPHYAIVEMPNEPGDAVQRERFFSDHNIRPLWFPQRKFEAIDIFLQALGAKRP